MLNDPLGLKIPLSTWPCCYLPETRTMTSPNGLVCFTNCLLPQEDGSLLQSDLWIDEREGIIVDAKVRILN